MAETTKPYPAPSKLSEQLQNLCWRIAVELRAVYNTVQTKISQADADKLYLGIKDKAVSATTADSATKATQDGSGNVIAQTYAKNTSLPKIMTAATSSAAGASGLVPAPAAGANAKYLRGDGTWQTPTNTTYNVMTAATSSAAGKAGLVPAPAAGKQAQYLRGDGTWATPTNTTYNVMTAATASAAGKAGLVPKPSAGANAKFLRGDGTWQAVQVEGTQIETETYSITEETTTAQSYALGTFAHVLVYVNSVLATDGGTYGIVGGTTLKFNDILPVGTEVTVIKFVTAGSVTPTVSYAIDSALSTTSQNAVQNKAVAVAVALKANQTDVETLITNALKQAKLDAHPIGSYYWSSESTSPASLFGGTWTQIKDKFLYAAGSKAVGVTGGEETHTLTAAELAAHGHNIRVWNNAGTTGTALAWTNNGTTKAAATSGLVVSGSAGTWTTPPIAAQGGIGDGCGTADQSGSGAAHNNMPPYIVAYCWRRTA